MRLTARLTSTFAVAILVFALFSPAQALSLRSMSFNDLKKTADAVVLARVQSVRSEATDEPGMHGVQTRITFKRERTLSGKEPAEVFDLVTPGGSVGKLNVAVPGVPKFSADEQVTLFLRKLEGAPGEYGVVGHGMGVYRIADNCLKPDVETTGGPAIQGESWKEFTSRFSLATAPALNAMPSENGGSAESLWPKMILLAVAAVLLLVAVLVRRRRHRAALILAFSMGIASLLASPGSSHAAGAGSRGFVLSGPKWDLSKQTIGRVSGGRVLWVRGVGTPDIPDDTAFSIITNSFQKWEDLPQSAIAFRQDGVTIELGNGVDQRNDVSFQQKVPRKAFDPQTLAITFIVFEGGTMVDTDIVFNNQDHTWVPSGTDFSLDVVSLHEIGHLLGLDHTNDPSDVMFPVARGVTNFSQGDMDGAATLYPVTPAQPPFAIIFASPAIGVAPLNVSFSSAPSVSRVTEPLSVLWDFGDGTATSTELSPSHVYGAAGTYTTTLTVTDSAGSNSSTATIVVGAPGKELSVSKFQFKVNLVAPVRSSAGKDAFSLTLSGADVQPGDHFSFVVGSVRVDAAGGAVELDSRGQFKADLGATGKLSAKTNPKTNELTIALTNAQLGIAFDPRGPADTSQSGTATFPVTLLIFRGGQNLVQTTSASFFYAVKTGNTPGGFLEKTISGKK